VTPLQKLAVIQRKKILYDIVFRRAGVALQFYDGPTDINHNSEWKSDLTIQRYYPTLTRAIDAEYRRLKR
jgi:hypothetical protein